MDWPGREKFRGECDQVAQRLFMNVYVSGLVLSNLRCVQTYASFPHLSLFSQHLQKACGKSEAENLSHIFRSIVTECQQFRNAIGQGLQ